MAKTLGSLFVLVGLLITFQNCASEGGGSEDDSGDNLSISVAGLNPSSGTLVPNFSSETFEYTAEVSFLVNSLSFTPNCSNSETSFSINGVAKTCGASVSLDIEQGENTFEIVFSLSGASSVTYTVIVNKQTIDSFVQTAYLKASNTEADDEFGTSIAVDGDTIVVGAPGEDSNATGVNGDETDNSESGSGAAYVFVKNGSTWSQEAYLKASNAGGSFGASVDISGDTIVVGAPTEDSGASDVDGDDTDTSDPTGGAAFVFFRSGSTWSQQAYLKGPAFRVAAAKFGASVAIDQDTVVVGARFDGPGFTNAGTASVFVRSGSTWSVQTKLEASNIDAEDRFGTCVAISGDTIVVGAAQESSSASGVNGDEDDDSLGSSGAAYVFTRSGTTWSQQAYLKASNPDSNDFFAGSLESVAIDGDTIVVGATGEDSSALEVDGDQDDDSKDGAGAAYVFFRSGTTWSQQAYIKPSNLSSSGATNFGGSVSIDEDTIVVGASTADTDDGDRAGVAYMYVRADDEWVFFEALNASNTGADLFRYGESVDVHDGKMVVSTPFEESNSTGVNGSETDTNTTKAGAGYILEQ